MKLIDFGTCKHFNKPMRILERLSSPYYMAPEVISGNSNEKCDMWSLGVILYVMLSGMLPFNGNNDREILMSIMTSDPPFEGKIWRQVSPDAKELITSMLTREISARPSAEQVLENSWLQTCGRDLATDKKLTKSSLKRLSNFCTTSKLHRAILAFIVSLAMSSEQISMLRETFKSMDKTRDGLLSKDDLIHAIGGLSGDTAINMVKLLDAMHKDGNGSVNYNELLTSVTNWEKELSRERLNDVLKKFDKDGSGGILVKEFVGETLESQTSQAHVLVQMVNEANANDDGVIDFEEFCNFMEKIKDSNKV